MDSGQSSSGQAMKPLVPFTSPRTSTCTRPCRFSAPANWRRNVPQSRTGRTRKRQPVSLLGALQAWDSRGKGEGKVVGWSAWRFRVTAHNSGLRHAVRPIAAHRQRAAGKISAVPSIRFQYPLYGGRGRSPSEAHGEPLGSCLGTDTKTRHAWLLGVQPGLGLG